MSACSGAIDGLALPADRGASPRPSRDFADGGFAVNAATELCGAETMAKTYDSKRPFEPSFSQERAAATRTGLQGL